MKKLLLFLVLATIAAPLTAQVKNETTPVKNSCFFWRGRTDRRIRDLEEQLRQERLRREVQPRQVIPAPPPQVIIIPPRYQPRVEGNPRVTPPVEGNPRVMPPVEGNPRITPPIEGSPRITPPTEGSPRITPTPRIEGSPGVTPDVGGVPFIRLSSPPYQRLTVIRNALYR